MEWLINQWKKESKVLKGAPIAFVLTLLLAFSLAFSVISWHYSERIAILDAEASLYRKKPDAFSLKDGLAQIKDIQKLIYNKYPEIKSYAQENPEEASNNLKNETSIENPFQISAQGLAVCIFAASKTYQLPPSILLGLLSVEGGRIGQETKKDKATYLGPLQISSLWLPELAEYWEVSKERAFRMVRDDACVNIGVGAWILRSKINDTGEVYKALGYYHSASRHIQPELFEEDFREKVMQAMERAAEKSH